MQDFKLVGREMNICISSIKNFADLETHLLIPIKQGSELYIEYFLNHISETLKSKTEAPSAKFYALFLLLRASQLQNYSFFYLLATKSDQLTNMVFHYAQVDSSSTIPVNRKGIQIFSKVPSHQEGIIGVNFLRLCQELVIYWYETSKAYKPRETFEIFQYIYSCTKKKCLLPKLYHFLGQVFDLNHDIALCDFSIKSPYIISEKEKNVEESQHSDLLTLEDCGGQLANNIGSESSLSMDEDFEMIMNPHHRSRHRTSTTIDNVLQNSRRGSFALTVNSQTEISSAPKDNPLTAVLKRAMFQSKKNFSLPPQSSNCQGIETIKFHHDCDDDSVSHSPLSKGTNSEQGSPDVSRFSGLLKEDEINFKHDERKTDKTDGSEVLSRGSRRKVSMDDELQEIQNAINSSNKSTKTTSLNPSLTNISTPGTRGPSGFNKLFESGEDDAQGNKRRSSFHDMTLSGQSEESFASPKPALRKSKFSILVTSDQKSEGSRENVSVHSASISNSPGKDYTMMKRQSNLEVVARVNSLFQDFKPEPRRSSCVTSIDRRFSNLNFVKNEDTIDDNETSLNLEADDSSPKSPGHTVQNPTDSGFTVRQTDYQPRLFFDKLLVASGSHSEVRPESDLKSPNVLGSLRACKREEVADEIKRGKISSSGSLVGRGYANENKALREKLKEYEEKIKNLEKQVGGSR